MPQDIEIPGQGVVEFPDGMDDEQITQAIQSNFPDLTPTTKPTMLERVQKYLPDFGAPTQEGGKPTKKGITAFPTFAGDITADVRTDVIKSLPLQAGGGLQMGGGGTLEGIGNISRDDVLKWTQPTRILADLWEKTGQKAPDWMKGGDFAKTPAMTEVTNPALAEIGRKRAAAAEAKLTKLTPKDLNDAEQTLITMSRSLGIGIPAVTAAVLTRSPNLALGIMGSMEWGTSYHTCMAGKHGGDRCMQFANTNAALEVIGERIPLGILFKGLSKSGGGSTVFKYIFAEVLTENPTEIAQSINEYSLENPKATLKDWYENTDLGRLIRITTASTILTSGIMGPTAVATQKAQQAFDKKISRKQAIEGEGTVLQPVKGETIKPVPGDRRQDTGTRKRIDEMSLDEARQALGVDELTGLNTRRVFNDIKQQPVKATIDADSLKFINDSHGHNAGDQLLRAIADVIRTETDQGFRFGGDEFVIQGQTQEQVADTVNRIQKRLAETTLTFDTPQGPIKQKGVGISFGIGETLAKADLDLQENKLERQKKGLRAARGEPIPVQTTEMLQQEPQQQTTIETEGKQDDTLRLLDTDTPDSGITNRAALRLLDGRIVYVGTDNHSDVVRNAIQSGIKPDQLGTGGTIIRGEFTEGDASVQATVQRAARAKPAITKAEPAAIKKGEPTPTQRKVEAVKPEKRQKKAPEAKKKKAAKPAEKKDKTKPDPKTDDLLTVIAKMGGLDRTEAQKQGIDPENFKRQGGRPVFRKEGGMDFDTAATRLVEMGYLQEHEQTPNAVLDLIDRALGGEKIYSMQVSDETIAKLFGQDDENRALNSGVQFYTNPIEPVIKGYQKAVDSAMNWMHDAFGWRMTPLGKLPAQDIYLAERYRLLGKIANTESVANKVWKLFENATAQDRQAAYDYLTNRITPENIKSPDVQKRTVAVKKLIGKVGDGLVERGLLSAEVVESHKGKYLPRLYMKHILGDSLYKALGSDKKISDLGFTKQRKDLPKVVRDLLGEITDPGFLASRGIGVPMRDMAILDFFEAISKNEQWVFKDSLVKWNNRNVSVFWLTDQASMLRKQLTYYNDAVRNKANEILKRMDAVIDAAKEKMGQMPDDFKQVPDTQRYGRMRGMYIRKEIFDDLIGAVQAMPSDSPKAEWLLGYGGFFTKATQLWKMSKVALNPPTQIRNFVSNGILLHLSGVHFHNVPIRVMQAFYEIASANPGFRSKMKSAGMGHLLTKSTHWRVARKFGVTESTYSSNELFEINKRLLKLQAREAKGLKTKVWAKTKEIAGAIGGTAGEVYQMSEALFKTAKIIDMMKKGSTEEQAVLEAQKWLFDYSLIPPSVRYLRNAPVGVPFMTFYYKVFPRMVETFLKHPGRLLPYYLIPYLLAAMIADDYEVETEDVLQLRKSLPMWLQEKGHAMFLPWKDKYGRWQALDISYYLPWGMYEELIKEVSRGEYGKAFQTTGMFGGPLPDLIAAVKTGIDPFTKRPIFREGDPGNRQLASTMNYLWRMSMPTWLTDIGFAGHMLKTYSGHVNRFGDPAGTEVQSMLRLVGMNLYPIEPTKSRKMNIARMGWEIRKTGIALGAQMKNRNLSPEKRKKIKAEYKALIRKKMERLRKYRKESKPHPKLLTR